MRHATNCKFCKRPITVEIDEAYAALGDPFKLLPLACCNACADNRVSRRKLERKIQLVVTCLSLAGSNKTENLMQTSREQLTKLTRYYADMIARYHHMDGQLWEPSIVEQIIEKPDAWGETLSRMWLAFRQWQEQQSRQPELPV